MEWSGAQLISSLRFGDDDCEHQMSSRQSCLNFLFFITLQTDKWTMGTSQSWFWEMTVGLVGWGSSSHMIVVHKAGALSHSQDFLNPHPPIWSLTYLRTSTQSSISPNGAPNKWNLELRRLQDAISQVGIRYRRWDISSGSSISHLQWSIRKRKFTPDNRYKGSTAVYCLFVFCLFLCLFFLCCGIFCAFLTDE